MPDMPDTGSTSSFAQQVLTLVNRERAANRLSALRLDDTLSRYAAVKSQDMHDNGYFSHTSPTYGSPFDMMKSFGITYNYAGENIAMGIFDPRCGHDRLDELRRAPRKYPFRQLYNPRRRLCRRRRLLDTVVYWITPHLACGRETRQGFCSSA